MDEHGPGFCVPAEDHDREVGQIDAAHDSEVEKLKLCLMVLDATIYMLEPFLKSCERDFFSGQIQAARDAYQSATGEESMIGFRRGKPQEKP